MRRSLTIVLVLALLVAGGTGGWWWWQREERARDAAATAALTAYARAWQARDMSRVEFVDIEARRDFRTATSGLGSSPVTARVGTMTRDGSTASAPLTVTWTLARGVQWSYAVPAQVVDRAGTWAVTRPARGSWWQPDISVGDRLTLTRVPSTRGDLLDRGGAALQPMGTVYPVQLDPTRASAATARALERIVDEKAGVLVARLAAARRAGSRAPIPVITYRQADFDQRRDELDALKGVIYPRTEQPLGSTRTFGQPLLGTFGPVTAELVTRSDGRYAPGDRAGLSGLQGQYDDVLAGSIGLKVASSTGKVLFAHRPVDGHDVATTLDANVQAAAETALEGTGRTPGAIVAVDVPSGEVLAAASSPSSGFDRAITGRYPPGSAFKVVTAYDYLSGGITTPGASVACPRTITVDGRRFRNYEGESLGSPTFHDDFVHSCNTAFISFAKRLGADDLGRTAATLGIGGWGSELGVAGAFPGSVPASNGKTDKAASTIGQGRVEVSPLALAVMVGSVARGSTVPPVLVKDPNATPVEPVALDPAALRPLRAMMRDVVTRGTAPALRGTPGGTVRGKTGTAEFGAGDPPRTRAWFVGYQGRIAFAVLVEEGRSGGSVAAPIARAFLTELAR